MRFRVKPRFWFIMIIVTAIIFGVNLLVQNNRLKEGEKRIAELNERRNAAILKNNALADELEFAHTDQYIIRVARDELDMIMPGEVRYISAN